MRNKKSSNADMVSKNFGFLSKPSGSIPNPYHARSSTVNPVTRQGSAFHVRIKIEEWHSVRQKILKNTGQKNS